MTAKPNDLSYDIEANDIEANDSEANDAKPMTRSLMTAKPNDSEA